MDRLDVDNSVFRRHAWCLLGIPIDAIGVATAVYRIPEKPYVIGRLFILYGWLRIRLLNLSRYETEGFWDFLKRYHRRSPRFGKHQAIAEIDAGNASGASVKG